MNSFTKFIGTVLTFYGLLLLMACYENIDATLGDTIFLGINGLIFCSIGIVCWIWCEPINDDEEN